ncbi:hypothetical protein [Microcoleus sp.]
MRELFVASLIRLYARLSPRGFVAGDPRNILSVLSSRSISSQ